MTFTQDILLALQSGTPMETVIDRIVAHAHTVLIDYAPQSHHAWRLLRAALEYRQKREWDTFEQNAYSGRGGWEKDLAQGAVPLAGFLIRRCRIRARSAWTRKKSGTETEDAHSWRQTANTASIEAETKSPPTLHEEEVRPKASAERKKRKGIQQQKKKESAQPWASEAPWLVRGKRMRIESGRREAGRLSEL